MYKKSPALIIFLLAVSLITSAALLFQKRDATRAFYGASAAPAGRMSGFPRIVLWAWERPVRLDFIDTREMGVAFLSKTLYLRGERVLSRPRLQPLSVPQGTVLIAVARIESDRKETPRLSRGQLEKAAGELAELAQLPGVSAVQIDFDATVTERSFYRDLLVELRRRMPGQMPLSITALASWCTHDDWLTGLPVDEAVPMLFRMGVDRRGVLSYLATGQGFRTPLCRGSSGISTDELLPSSPPGPRLYIFNAGEWSPASVNQILERFKDARPDS